MQNHLKRDFLFIIDIQNNDILMNITIITPVFPYPLNSGGAQAQFNMIDQLRATHKITLIYIEKSPKEEKFEQELKQRWPDVRIVVFTFFEQVKSLKFLYNKAKRAFKLMFMKHSDRFTAERALMPYGVFYTKKLINFINKTIKEAQTDIIQVEFYPCLHMVNYLPQNIKKIFIHHEIRFIRNERLLSSIRLTKKEESLYEKMKAQEIKELNCYDKVVTLTNIDKDILKKNKVTNNIVCSPAAINSQIREYASWKGKILLLGGYSHKPNVEGLEWFINEIACKQDLHADIHIVGSGWPDKLIDSYKSKCINPIIYHGFVENLYDVAQGSIMAIPILTGSGMRMKILEAAAMGLPFITTSVGVEGLEFMNKESCIIEDSPSEWIKSLQLLCTNEEIRKTIAINAQNIFKTKYSLKAAINQREQIYHFI